MQMKVPYLLILMNKFQRLSTLTNPNNFLNIFRMVLLWLYADTMYLVVVQSGPPSAFGTSPETSSCHSLSPSTCFSKSVCLSHYLSIFNDLFPFSSLFHAFLISALTYILVLSFWAAFWSLMNSQQRLFSTVWFFGICSLE